MSGGHFDFAQCHMKDIACEIENLIKINDSTKKDEREYDLGYHFPPKIIERFKEAAHTTIRAYKMIQRIDWLVSGDDSEEAFMSRWDSEVQK